MKQKAKLRHGPVSVLAVLAISAALAAPADARVVLGTGHIDAGSATVKDGRIKFLVKDITQGRTVWRRPNDVLIKVNRNARTRLPDGAGFVGPEGMRVWMIPQVQRKGVIWAGWNTQKIAPGEVKGNVKWKVMGISGPGRLVVFQTGSFGEQDVIFNSSLSLPQRLAIPPGVHAHANWAFTRRGVYKMRSAMVARSVSGRKMIDKGTLKFKVG